jgi:hypothetical protein
MSKKGMAMRKTSTSTTADFGLCFEAKPGALPADWNALGYALGFAKGLSLQAYTTDSRRQRPPEPLTALPVRFRGPFDPWHPRLDHLGRAFLSG